MSLNMEQLEPTAAELDGAILIKDPKKRRKCPVCSCNLYLYYVTEEEMFLMCENDFCEFPYGYEPLQIVYDESQLVDNPPKCTPDFFEYPVGGINGIPSTPLGSIGSTTATTAMDTFSTLSSSMNDQVSLEETDTSSVCKDEVLSVRLKKEKKRRKLQKERETSIFHHLQNITQMNNELKAMDEIDKNINTKLIKNEKWLTKLKTWESTSGTQLLTEEEKGLLKSTKPELASAELKISVNPQSAIPSVNIEIVPGPAQAVKEECI